MTSWEETTYASNLYNEMRSFRAMAKDRGRDLTLSLLRSLIEKHMEEGDLNLAMLFMNELEILFGTNMAAYAEYENALAPVYREEMLKVKRPNCFLINPDIPRSATGIEEFKNKHKGERCFILGNGPSLNKLDLSLLKNEITFGVNSIFLNFRKMGYPVTYYAVEDSHVIRERGKEIANLEGSVRFIPHYAAKTIAYSPDNVYLNVVLDYTRYKGFPYFSTDISRRAWVGGTVSYINLQLAWYMGFDEIYMIGFDHSYSIPENAEVNGNDIKSCGDDPNHFHPDYFGKGYHWHIPLTQRMELCYRKADYAFSVNGRKIYNATPGGSLEVFERRKYEDIARKKFHFFPKFRFGTESRAPYDISIIISAYNDAARLPRCIESALNQYGNEPEVIVVDDGSTDDTAEICRGYAKKYKNLKFFSQKNKGCGGARNTGMKRSSAPYLTFLDSDDSLDSDFLYRAIAIMQESGADLLDFDYKKIVGARNVKKPREEFMLETGLDALMTLATKHSFSATERIYRRSFLERHNLRFLENCMHEDLLFTAQSHFYAANKAFLPVMGYNYHIRNESITSRIRDENIKSLELQLAAIRDFLIREGVHDRFYRMYHVMCYRIIRDVVLARVNSDIDSEYRIDMLRKTRNLMRRLALLDRDKIDLVVSFSKRLADEVLDSLFPLSWPQPRRNEDDCFQNLKFGAANQPGVP